MAAKKKRAAGKRVTRPASKRAPSTRTASAPSEHEARGGTGVYRPHRGNGVIAPGRGRARG